jgi:hypothetical protein
MTIDEKLAASLERASREGTPTLEIIDMLMKEERRRKENQKCRQRMKQTGFPTPMNFDDFDIDFQPPVGIEQKNELKKLRFIHNAAKYCLPGATMSRKDSSDHCFGTSRCPEQVFCIFNQCSQTDGKDESKVSE